jgi:hypothetical protein
MDRDMTTCSICRKFGSGVHYPKIFVCDACFDRLGADAVGEINECWG